MIFFSVGLPGRFAEWCDAVVTRLVERHFGPAGVMPAGHPEEVAVDLVRLAAPHLVAWTRMPHETLRALLAGPPLVVALDDPRRAVHELTTAHGIALRDATREVARSCAAAAVCAAIPGAVVLHAETAAHDPAAAVGAIAQALGIAPDEAMLAALPGCDGIAAAEPVGAWWEALTPEQRTLPDGALAAYRAHFAGAGLGEIVWDRSLLWCPEDGRDAGQAIEIATEPARLVAGPDIGLPPGHWAATVTLGVSREAAGTGFDIEIWAAPQGERLARTTIVPDARGIAAVTLPFTVAPATGHTIAFSIATSGRGAGGRLALGNLVLVPRRADGSDIPSELNAVLDWT